MTFERREAITEEGAPMIGRILLSLAAFALTGFVILTLIGLWDHC